MELDAGNVEEQDSATFIDALNLFGAPTSKVVVSFTDPFQNLEKETADTFDVSIEEVLTPRVMSEQSDQVRALVRVRGVSLV